MTRLLIIPAAGRGSRLGAGKPKPLVHVNGRTMLDHLADLYRPHVQHVVVIAHPSFAAEIAAWSAVQGNVSVATQERPTGMLDAVLLAAPAVRERQPEMVWITWADQVGVLPATVQRLAEVCAERPPPALALPTVVRQDPYTHFERDAGGRLSRFLQRREGDAMPHEGESDMGVFALARDTFERDLVEYAGRVAPGIGTGERNFVPFVPWLAQRQLVVTFPCTHPMEAVGINTPDELHAVEAWLRARDGRNE
jgi:bifunctional N-acetylglucosamine-1-phosphate-uridyltransferase/glucosamine-1-phosphate-acetyltransferase GlmU-like protein